VNPLLITSHFSKSINTLLRNFQPIANADFRPNRCLSSLKSSNVRTDTQHEIRFDYGLLANQSSRYTK